MKWAPVNNPVAGPPPGTGHAASNRRTSWRTSLLNVGVVTGTHVEIYRA